MDVLKLSLTTVYSNEPAELYKLRIGHVLVISRRYGGYTKTKQLPQVIEYINDRYGHIVDYGALEKIVKTVKSRMTNISRPGGKEKLRDYLHKLCDFVLPPLEETNANALLTLQQKHAILLQKHRSALAALNCARQARDTYAKTAQRLKLKLFDLQRKLATNTPQLGIMSSRQRQRLRRMKEQEITAKESLNRVKSDSLQLKTRLEEQLRMHNEEFVAMNEELQSLKRLTQELPCIQTKVGRTYTTQFRKAAFMCIRKQVPIENLSDVIAGVIKTICGKDLSHSPCVSTVINMISEMKVLSSIQAIKAILESKHVSLAWDATSLNGKHIDEVHVSTDRGYIPFRY